MRGGRKIIKLSDQEEAASTWLMSRGIKQSVYRSQHLGSALLV